MVYDLSTSGETKTYYYNPTLDLFHFFTDGEIDRPDYDTIIVNGDAYAQDIDKIFNDIYLG